MAKSFMVKWLDYEADMNPPNSLADLKLDPFMIEMMRKSFFAGAMNAMNAALEAKSAADLQTLHHEILGLMRDA